MREKIEDPVTLLSLKARASMELYTKLAFAAQHKQKFITAKHHQMIFEALQDVVDGKCPKLIINIAPRYSKTELAVKNFISYGFALNPRCQFIHLSYSDTLVADNSRAVQDIMASPIYAQLFPESALSPTKRINANKWKTPAGGGMYAVSTQGQVTGFGAGAVEQEEDDKEHHETQEHITEMRKMREEAEDEALAAALEEAIAELQKNQKDRVFWGAIIIDDPIKPEDALSPTMRERVNQRFETTIRNRVNSRHTPIIIMMQRLHENDLCGYLMKKEPGEWRVLSIPCIETDENGEEHALWEHKHTLAELKKIKAANSYVFETQYMQDPKPVEGLMYSQGFKTYDIIPATLRSERKNYTDTADTGADYLCSICYTETELGCYVTDILYTKKPMEYTEPATAQMLTRNKTRWSVIESNNGGRGFGRNVGSQMKLLGNFTSTIIPFNQTENKQVRIFSKSAEAQNMVFFPTGWESKWPEFATAILTYRKETKNDHDDAPDALTGVVENFNKRHTSSTERLIQNAH